MSTAAAAKLASPRSISDLVAAAADKYGDAVFLVPADREHREISFNDLSIFAKGCGALLDDHGSPEGSRVAVVLHNSPLAVLLTLGVMAANRVLVPLNPKSGKAELDIIADQAAPVAILGDHAVAAKVGDRPGWHSIGDENAFLDEVMALGRGNNQNWTPTNDDPRRDAEIVYTSGSTGVPKGVVLSHWNLVSLADALARWTDATPDDLFLNVVPIFHTGGQLFPTLTPLLRGARTVCVRSEVALGRFWRYVESFDPTWTLVVNAYLGYLVEQSDTPASCRLRGVLAGGSPLSPGLRQRFEDRFGLDVFQVYGLTESSSIAAVEARARPADGERGVGRTLDCVRARVVDRDGNDVPAGADGEILLAGDSLFSGYLDRPDLTAKTVRDGWLHTGDVGHFADDGEMFIVDRLDSMLIVGGENVYPAEVENLVPGLEGIADAVLVGLPHAIMGVELALVYTLLPDASPQAGRWRRALNDSLSTFKVPRKYIPLAELGFEAFPLSPVGKILRTEIQRSIDSGAYRPAG